MSALTKACTFTASVKNTGKVCDTAMTAAAMIIMVDPKLKWTLSDMEDFDAYVATQVHLRKMFPLFGLNAPIRNVINNQETDVTATLEDGLQVFIRFGILNRTFETTSGGLCYAEALNSFLNSGFKVIEIDSLGQTLMRKNSDGTFSGLITDYIAPATPQLADFRNPYKNRFSYSFSPVEMVTNGTIMKGGSSLLSMMGLIDSYLYEAAEGTTTDVTIGVKAECSDEDIVSDFPVPFAVAGNFFINKKSDGSSVAITARTVTGNQIELAATLVSGTTYIVSAAAPSVWKTNGIEGYDASAGYDGSVEITIP